MDSQAATCNPIPAQVSKPKRESIKAVAIKGRIGLENREEGHEWRTQ